MTAEPTMTAKAGRPRTGFPGAIRGVLVALALLVVLPVAFAAPAGAHAALTAAEPVDGAVLSAPPARLVLEFSEPVSPLALRLVTPDGTALPLDRFVLRDRALEIAAPAGLGEGTHVLSWRVISEDGHPVGGAVVFSIGVSSAAPPLPEPVEPFVRAGLLAVKVALYLGLFVGVGGAVAGAWLVAPAAAGARPGRGVAVAALCLGVVGAIAAAGFQGLDALGAPVAALSDPRILAAGLSTRFGVTVAAALAAIAAAAVALSLPTGRPAMALAVLAGLLAAGALAASGHAGTAEPRWLARGAVFLHAAAILLWVGALAPLAAALRAGGAAGAAALARFSAAMPAVLAVLVLAGTVLAVLQVETPAALLATDYGRLLVAKLAAVAVLFALAAVNRWRLTRPALAGEPRAQRALRRLVAVEVLVVLLVLALAAGWRFTPPPRALAAAAAAPAAIHIHTARAMADVTVTPGRAGPVEIAAVVMTGDFGALDAREVGFVLALPEAGIEPIRRKASRGDDGIWRAGDLVLPLAGTWRLRVDVLVTDFEIVRLDGEIVLR